MSQENVEIIRQKDEAFNRRDREAFLVSVDSDAEWHVTGVVVDQKTLYRGRDHVHGLLTIC